MAKPAIFICQWRKEKKEKEIGQLWEREGEGWSRKPAKNGGLGGGKPSWGSVQA